MLKDYLKKHMRLCVANNMLPLCLGSTNGKNPNMSPKKSKVVHQKTFIRERKGLIVCKTDFLVFFANISISSSKPKSPTT